MSEPTPKPPDDGSDVIAQIRAASAALTTEPPGAEALIQATQALAAATEWLTLYEHNFNLRWNATQRAIKRWQQDHPGNDDRWPDHADLCVWLMEQLSIQTVALFKAHTLLQHLRRTETFPSCCSRDFADRVSHWLDNIPIFPTLHPEGVRDG